MQAKLFCEENGRISYSPPYDSNMSQSVPTTTAVSNHLTHFDAQGQAHMVDVAAKAATHRIAVAQGRIEMLPSTYALIEAGNAKKAMYLASRALLAYKVQKPAISFLYVIP